MKTSSKCKCLYLDLLNPNEFYGHFVFTSLEKSEGTTIGNMLRRTLLSNLYGVRITGVRVAGTNNEFTPLEGVREDLLEIILNLKEIIVYDKNNTGQPCYGRLKAHGPAIVTAGALILPNDIKILNPNAHLLTISDNSLVELELRIEYGKSYTLAKDQKLEGAPDFIPIDSNFAPVLKVNWYIKPLSQAVENNNEELHLEIFTNGTVLPHQALLQARNMIGYMLSTVTNIEFPCFDLKEIKENNIKDDKSLIQTNIGEEQKMKEIKDYNYNSDSEKGKEKVDVIKEEKHSKGKEKVEVVKEKLAKEKPKSVVGKEKMENPEEKLLQRIADMESGSLKGLGLSNRIIKVLNRANINFTWDLIQYSTPKLRTIGGLGPKSIEEIENKLDLFFEPPI
uniref:RNA polymerase alpha subunit n=1 Tax=Sporochnus bolleanus TaxID=461143 RepID=UPI002E76ED1A|nr:RNA polymerase alpha subunit [Sporochnus bolleanus]WAM64826.1 RNA polymerase alpha subunit [Sporochnus bolleanus]